MKKCAECGTELPDGAKFCFNCGASTQVQANLTGSGAVAQGREAIAAGEGAVVVGRDVQGDVILVADPDQLWQAIRRRPPTQDLRQATERYLACLVDRHRYLNLKGMGVSDRVPLRLPLAQMYVPLRARIELPEGETWARGLKLAGRELSEEDQAALGEHLSAPQPVLDLLQAHSGLIVLGDPGAGKTTFLKHLTLGLATGQEEQLGLGVRLPVLVPLSAYANALAGGRDVRLDDFIAGYFHDLGADLPIGQMLGEALEEGGALVLLDGLDEVQEPALRQTVVERVLDFYTFQRPAGNKFVLTSRIVGYREVRPVAEGLAECTLVDFEGEEIETFVSRWTTAIEVAAHGDTPVAAQEAAREKQELLAAIQRSAGVRRLAANPLLLTILALMKRQGVTLPERRVELYDQYVRTLLSSWNRARGLGRPPTRDLDVVETVRILAPLALWMHQVSPGVGLVKRGDLRRKLVEIYSQQGEDEPERASRRFLADVRQHAGLLLERGAGQYGFIHLTFEEYLAAIGLARLGQRNIEPIVDLLARHVGDPAWREVALLAVGYLGIVQQQEQVAGDVVGALLERQPGEPGEAAALVGQAVVDAWPGGVTLDCREKVVAALVQTLGDDKRVAAPVRAEAGRVLARLGDPRPGVIGLEGMEFCLVPAGPFTMGEGGEQHKVTLPAYHIARYPVTVAQFQAFVEASGYRPGDRDSLRGVDNHPVVWINWRDARAFCNWLTEHWREDGVLPEDWQVRLPSEAEWEKAARGGIEIPAEPLIAAVGASFAFTPVQNPNPQRRYPWGDDPDSNRANYGESGIGTTSAVGCFPGGASPYGCQDMSGNVWEWTSSLYESYPYDPEDGRENPDSTDSRVLRGGAFFVDEVNVRCAARSNNDPFAHYRIDGFRVVVSPISLPPLPSGTQPSGTLGPRKRD